MKNQEYISLKELCNTLSINIMTGRNWLKLNKITCQANINGKPVFTKRYLEQLRKQLNDDDNKYLKSRRNKKYISGNFIYNSYIDENSENVKSVEKILDYINDNKIICDDFVMQVILADCATKLMCQNNKFECYSKLIDDLIYDSEKSRMFIKENLELFDIQYTYKEGEDLLGFIYMSCRNIGNRKFYGAYYTPTKVVKKLISKTFIGNYKNQKVLDPCCGTGNFLLQLPNCIDINNIYGNDIDEISVKITRINLALKYNIKKINVLYEKITCIDFLNDYKLNDFDYIIGNPPWGYNFSAEDRKALSEKYLVATLKALESYDVFLEASLKHLNTGGVVSYVLPEAILNVKSHSVIRKIIVNSCDIKNIVYLDNIFHMVQCPSIILKLKMTGKPINLIGMSVERQDKKYIIKTNRKVDYNLFDFNITDDEYNVIDKIYNTKNCTNLKGRSTFALGIVTGNNAKYITKTKTDYNEIIIKGTDVFKYKISAKDNYIEFKPEMFQQVAKEGIYRAEEKLLYRFISNELIFAYDNKGLLSLNSCNLVIPNIKGLNIKYIMTVLNSRIAQFIFKNKFNSLKVLRAHIEDIPIPIISEEKQKTFVDLADEIMKCKNHQSKIKIYNYIDANIAKLFNLSKKEYQIILQNTGDILKL